MENHMILHVLFLIFSLFLASTPPASAVPFTPGVYQLHNHPDGSVAPPLYGLRLDGLNSLDTDDIYTFDFDAPGASIVMDYTGTTAHIYGTMFGGLNQGSGYDDPAFYDLDMSYTVVATPGHGDRVFESTNPGTNSGTVQRTGGPVINLIDFGGPPTFIVGFGHRSGPEVLSGRGWFSHSDAPHIDASDFLFTVGEPVPEPSTALLLGGGLLMLAGVGRKRG